MPVDKFENLDQHCEILIDDFETTSLDYCNSLLNGLPQYQIKKLQYVQNAAARLTFTGKHEHITPILKIVHRCPVNERINFKILVLTFKTLNRTAQTYLCDILAPYQPTRLYWYASGLRPPWGPVLLLYWATITVIEYMSEIPVEIQCIKMVSRVRLYWMVSRVGLYWMVSRVGLYWISKVQATVMALSDI
jgi:hypothetical protein